ncbi:hypothetical protein QYB58_000849 [Clostridium perfringens]|nr:hypothetical protein [Clostridium perfringens]
MQDYTGFTIKNFESKITLFYSTNTGEIKLTAGGIQDMSYFGPDAADFNYNFLVIDKDDYLLSNLEKFIIQDNKVKLKEAPISKYEIAE